MARLGDACSINPKPDLLDDTLQVSFVPMQKVSETGDIDVSEIKLFREVKKGFTAFRDGDVLLAKITPCMENGKGAIAKGMFNGVGFGSTEFHVLRPNYLQITSEWLFYLTSWEVFRKECEIHMTGSAGQKRVPKAFLDEYEIRIPTLDEQQNIVRVLDRICNLITLRKQQLAKLDELVKARFVEMFGDPACVINRLPRAPMTALCEIIDGDRGANYPKQNELFEQGDCLFLNAKNVTATGFSFDSCMFITREKDMLMRKGKLRRGDVVLTTRGTIGNLAIYDDKVPFDNIRINSGMVILRMKPNCLLEVFFMEQFKLLLTSIKERVASGSAQPQLPISTMNNIRMLIPAVHEQQKFTSLVEKTAKSKLTIQQSLAKLEVLKKSLMQEYFG